MYLLPLLIAAACHPLSVSSSRVVVARTHVRLELRCQAATLVECLPIDTDHDHHLDTRELESARDAIERYVVAGYRVAPISDPAIPLLGHLESATLTPNPTEPLVDLVFQFESPTPLHTLRIDFDLFRAADPLHRDHAQILWNGAAPEARALWVEDPSWSFTPSDTPHSILGAYISLGIEHILSGYDHIAFLVALLVGSRRIRSIVAVVTAFTLAHSITLALAAFGILSLSPTLVEPAIAASIAFVAARNILSRNARTLWPEAFAFGLIHGLGFAGSISETLASETQKALAILGFNLGVEVGQLTLVTAFIALLTLAHRLATRETAPHTSASLVPAWARITASSIVAALGLYWFVARISGH